MSPSVPCFGGVRRRQIAAYDRPVTSLLAISDLHVNDPENRRVFEGLRARSPRDWLIVCGDVSELSTDVEWALGLLRERFDQVVWVPGNHDLWSTSRRTPLQQRGQARYRHLVEVVPPSGSHHPRGSLPDLGRDRRARDRRAAVPALRLLLRQQHRPYQGAVARAAHAAGVVCSDELVLHPDPHPSREAWCAARVHESELASRRKRDPELPTVLVNHFPLIRDPTQVLYHPEFAQWCGTVRTADWHVRFGAKAVVYGHLHIPRVTWHDGVRFTEVSLGYPREWRRRRGRSGAYGPESSFGRHAVLHPVLPEGDWP